MRPLARRARLNPGLAGSDVSKPTSPLWGKEVLKIDPAEPNGQAGHTVRGESCAAGSGMAVSLATSLDQVIEAWRLVYRCYTRARFIDSNPWGIHTVRPAVAPDTAVILGHRRSRLANSMTVHFDGALGLSLDAVYREELDRLRGEGRKLAEVGLFADRRDFSVRSTNPLMQLMGVVWHYSTTHGVTDGVIGVNPRHEKFYSRWLGFERIGPIRQHRLVDAPVALLHLKWKEAVCRSPMPRGYPMILARPFGREYFADRLQLESSTVEGSIIADFLEHTSESGG